MILDFGKCPNQKTQESESAGFLVWALPVIQNQFLKQISNKVLYSYHSNFSFQEFWSIFKKKNGFFHCIFKKWFDRRRVLFSQKKKNWKANHPKICLSLWGSMPEAQIKQCPLTPSPKSQSHKTFLFHKLSKNALLRISLYLKWLIQKKNAENHEEN